MLRMPMGSGGGGVAGKMNSVFSLNRANLFNLFTVEPESKVNTVTC